MKDLTDIQYTDEFINNHKMLKAKISTLTQQN